MFKKNLILIICVVINIQTQSSLAKPSGSLKLTSQEIADIVQITPMQRELLDWVMVSDQLIPHRAMLIDQAEGLIKEASNEKECKVVAAKAFGTLNSKVPLKILVALCHIRQFKKRDPRFGSEGF